MKSGHDEIGNLLPEYARGALPGERYEAVEAHLRECAECREERELLVTLSEVAVPDPGDLYWKTLPQRVRGDMKEPQSPSRWSSIVSFLLRPLPVAAAAVLMIFVLVLSLSSNREMQTVDPLFQDPLRADILDYSDINERDVSLIARQMIAETDAPIEGFSDESYHRDLATLDAREVRTLAEELEREQRGG